MYTHDYAINNLHRENQKNASNHLIYCHTLISSELIARRVLVLYAMVFLICMIVMVRRYFRSQSVFVAASFLYKLYDFKIIIIIILIQITA